MQLRKETTALFRDLLNYCREDQCTIPSGVREDRAPTYRRLVRNIIFGNLENAYPIAKTTLSEEHWDQLLTDFFAEWKIPSPELWKMPYSLLEYVCHTNYGEKINAPYLEDLLLFEWTEIEVFMMPNANYPALREINSVTDDTLQLNLESLIIAASYPVHKENGPDFKSAKANYLVLGYRDPKTLAARFVELTPAAAVLVELLREEPKKGSDLLLEAAEKLSLTNTSDFIKSGESILREFVKCSVLVGAIK